MTLFCLDFESTIASDQTFSSFFATISCATALCLPLSIRNERLKFSVFGWRYAAPFHHILLKYQDLHIKSLANNPYCVHVSERFDHITNWK